MNMAVEEAIARNVGKRAVSNTIRFWENANTVVIGSYQDANAEADLEQCAKYHVDVVRRFTGGGAVYQDEGNLNFAIALFQDCRLVNKDLLDTFRILSKGVVLGLRILGMDDAKWERQNCILTKNLKISGLAGCVRWGTFFCHGSMLVSSDLSFMNHILGHKEPSDPRFVRSLTKPVTTISHEVGRQVPLSEVKAALQTGFQKVFEIKLIRGELTSEELRSASQLLKEKYSRREWNLGNPWEQRAMV